MSAANSSIVHDLVEEILRRLPVKSILRFKSVSKRWKASIESQGFVQRHVKNCRRKILLSVDSSDGGPPSLGEEEEDICYIRNFDASRFSLTCDGLICIPRSDSIEVCNPATRETRQFPLREARISRKKLGREKRIPVASVMHIKYMEDIVPKFPTQKSSFGFGKDEITGTYKVVELRDNNHGFLVQDCNVLDLKTGQWRQLGEVPYRIFGRERSVHVNGSVHWFGVDRWEPNASNIIAFDLHTEEFRVVSYPNISVDTPPPLLAELLILSLGKNRLCVSETRKIPDFHLLIWSMVDDDVEWVKMHSICLCGLRPNPCELKLFTPVVISKQGDGVVVLVWDNRHTLFKSSPENIFLHKISTDARVVASSYIPTLVPLPQLLT